MGKIRDWFSRLSGTTKFMIALSCILFVSNILLNNALNHDANSIIDASESGAFSPETEVIYEMYGLGDLFHGQKQAFERVVVIVFTCIGCYVSYWIGTILGAIKSLAELFADIASDGIAYFAFLLYDIIGIFFDVLSIVSLITSVP